MQGMDPRGGAGPSGSNSLVPLAASLGAMAPPGSRTVLTRTTTQTVSGIAPPAAAPFSKLRDLAAKMSSDQAQIAQQAKEAAAQLARGEEARHKLAADVASLSKQVRGVYLQWRGGCRAARTSAARALSLRAPFVQAVGSPGASPCVRAPPKQLGALATENSNLLAANHELKAKALTLQRTVQALQTVAVTHQGQVATCASPPNPAPRLLCSGDSGHAAWGRERAARCRRR